MLLFLIWGRIFERSARLTSVKSYKEYKIIYYMIIKGNVSR